ncbi:MAG: D-alanine--D-alanine ligase [Clostridium sp.]|jgi:D-alanine-D-alanine ligase|nr:D-alanine--D-alanine ligase [Clostridium sp.]
MKRKIVVLAGGTSAERDVSLSSGSMVYKALKKRGYRAILVDVYLGYDGDCDRAFESDRDWAEGIEDITETSPDLERIRQARQGDHRDFFGRGVLKLCRIADVVFLALHGANGEDGKVQACFELMGIRYTGTGFVSSAIAMDKGLTKDIFRAYQIPAPTGIRLWQGKEESCRIPFPCIVKTVCGGSSVGVFLVRNEEEYERARKEAFGYGKELIIEQYIEGREFSVGVLGGKALPVIEIAPKQGFYDYKNKYQAGSTVETCPAQLSQEQTQALQEMAEKVFSVLRMSSYARMDFRMNPEGEIFCLEANSLPGMTPLSLLPQEAAAAGMDFEDLCEEIIRLSLQDGGSS